MTLSNNAIKFLQAQYRAIFKRAYVKGLATAVLLTAGLAAGQAQAISWEGNVLVTSTANDTYGEANATVGGIKINAGHSLTTSGSIISNGEMKSEGNLTIESGSILLANKDNENQTIYRYDFTSNGGNITMTGNIGAASFSISGGNLVLNSGGEGNTNLTAYGFGWKQGDTDGSKSPEYYDRGKANGLLSGVNITVKKDTNVSALNRLTIENSTVTLSGSGGTLAVNSESGDLSSYLQGSKQIKISKTTITVSGSNNAIVSANGQINDSTINVNSGATLLITGAHSHGLAQYSLSNTNIINQGELILGETSESGSDSFTFTGGSMKNTGIVTVNADKLSVTEEYFKGLFAGESSKVTFSGSAINVDGEVDLNGLGIISSGNGSLDSNRMELDGDGATLTADTVTLGTSFNTDKLTLDVGTLNISGAANSGGTQTRFNFNSGEITVHNELKGSADNQVVRLLPDSGQTATLNLAAGANDGVLTDIDRINVGLSNFSGSSNLNIDGTWDFNDARISVSSGGTVAVNGTANEVSELMLDFNGKVTVDGSMTIERLLGGQASGSSSMLSVNGTLTVTGDGSADGDTENHHFDDVYLTQSKVTINNGGKLAITTSDALDDFITVSGNVVTVATANSGDLGGWSSGNVTLNAGGTLQLNLAALGVDTISQDNLSSLKESLVASGSKGSFDFGDGSCTYNLRKIARFWCRSEAIFVVSDQFGTTDKKISTKRKFYLQKCPASGKIEFI